jgi:hypothetical protein
VSKLDDVETVESVEGAEATRKGYQERKAVTLDEHCELRVQSRVSCSCPHANHEQDESKQRSHSFRDAGIPTVT